MRIVEKQTITNDMFSKPNMESVGILNKQNNERMDGSVANNVVGGNNDGAGVKALKIFIAHIDSF